MHNNDNESWCGYVKQFLGLKQMEIGRLPIKMGRYIATMKPIIQSKSLTYIHEVPANNVANKGL
jgi:hypothetical protein